METITIGRRTLTMLVIGTAALTAGSIVAIGAWPAGAAPGDTDTTFVPIEPCRLVDTRPTTQVGPRGSTIGVGETLVVDARGNVGECSLPADATGLLVNATAIGATLPTFLTFWASGQPPLASSLNPSPGQPPTPNQVSVPLAGNGTFRVFNLQGAVHLLVDVVGYRTPSSLADLHERLSELEQAQTLSVSNRQSTVSTDLTTSNETIVSVNLTAPTDGHVVVNSSAVLRVSPGGGLSSACSINTVEDVDANYEQGFERDTGGPLETLAGTRGFDVEGGESYRFRLVCQSFEVGAAISDASITALFTPLGGEQATRGG